VDSPSILFCSLVCCQWCVFAINLTELQCDATKGEWVQAYFCAQELSTATNLQKQANICIIIGALMHHSRWHVFAIFFRVFRGKEGGVHQAIICITIGTFMHHSKVWCTSKEGVVASQHKEGIGGGVRHHFYHKKWGTSKMADSKDNLNWFLQHCTKFH
jgi:hypothetical protein